MITAPPDARERGFALLIVLWALAGLSLLTTMIIAGAGSALRETRLLSQTARMEALAQGGIESAIFHESGSSTTRWPLTGAVHLEKIDGFTMAISVESEASRINPNTAPFALLSALVQECGGTQVQSGAIAHDMVAWRRQSQGEDGAERQHYLTLGLRYLPPYASFQTIAELELIPGMTRPLLSCMGPHLSIAQPEELHAPVTDALVQRALARAGQPALPATTASYPFSFVATVRISDGQGGGATRRATVLIPVSGGASDPSGRSARIIDLSTLD
ncbi:type II secretion system minor pseudopilin [Asaia krungthepensis]|uniref:Type III secretion component protein PulK n=1 Tax=Asaia krungthepensis NRIC 0535 TaxID=1307925 RepID=A0ABQ0Q260_9PROT|nr:general secretion pathway protein GspK [Asaia krungthepensis]GBQ87725.1 type III secretion component protein PulK [Asaia krungthepensis NRIC 0535]